jgi:hypothetical protein
LSLLRRLANAFAPGARSPGAKTFRDLARETGAYRGALGGYRPYVGDHEPPERVSTEPRARIVHGAILAAEAERVAEVTALLEREGLTVAPTLEAWDAIGAWVMRNVEGSREPGSAERAPFVRDRVGGPAPKQVDGESTTELRPLWRSVAFDLALLLGRHMIGLTSGGRWAREGELRGGEESAAAAPLVVHGDRPGTQAPFGFVAGFMAHALALKLRVVQEPGMQLGDGLRQFAEVADMGPAAPTPAEAFVEDLEEQLGIGPLGDEDVALLLERHGLEALPPLPPRLAALMTRE